MEIEPLAIADVKLIRPRRHGDARGFFAETFKASAFAAAGLPTRFPQDNHAASAEAGTLRGLHFQAPPAAQGKLVRVAAGAIYDVVVDLRASSPTFGRFVAAELSAENFAALWAPEGFAHGYQTLTPNAVVLYKTTGEYAPALEAGLAWDDPALAIPWPLAPPVLSAKDRGWPTLAALKTPFA
jgi:dTDP-4-dehydrorhamnose 3,5-epimerase